MAEVKQIPFGPATIIINEGKEDEIRFDGKIGEEGSELQAEGGSITITPTFADITSIDFGANPFDHYSTGVTVTVQVVALHESAKLLKLAIANTADIVDADSGEVTGVADAPIGQSNRDRSVSIRIHPRNMGDDKSLDYFVYKAAPMEAFERPFSLEQGSVMLNFQAYPRDGADPTKEGNFFYTGAVDPNAEA